MLSARCGVTNVHPPRPAALPRQQAQPAERCSAAESTTAAEVNRQRRIEAARLVAASVGVATVPTDVIGRPFVAIVVLTEGDQFAIRLTPKRGWRGKSRPEGRITSTQGAPAQLRAKTAILSAGGGDGAAFIPGRMVGCGSSTWPLVRSTTMASKKVKP